MKFMKIALSVVAIAAIATIYSTGAFVSQTQGMDNTVDGFLVISNAEMTQQVGGQFIELSTGIPFYIPEGKVPDKFCDGRIACRKRNHKTYINASYYVCDNCLPPLNIFNLYQWNWPKYSRLGEDGRGIKIDKQIIVTCRLNEEGICEVHKEPYGPGGEHTTCTRYVEPCDD